jgi:F-type H+-transporting ATPase subunit gamma
LVRASIAATDIPTELILVGKKGESLAGTHQVVAQFPYPEAGLDAAAVLPIISFASESFLSGNYDRVYVAYTDFINAAKQNAKIRQLLPIKSSGSEEGLGIMGTNEQIGSNESFIQSKADKHSHREKYSFEYLFEPAPDKVLQAVVPRLLEIQLYQALLESMASEHSARMAAMHQATEAASDLGVELTLSYNKARQSAITAEIAEITAGVAALE